MLSGVLELLSKLSDEDFRAILPVLFNGIHRVTAHATDATLKKSVADIFARLSQVYGFGPM